jgi:hypothetical protein
MMHKDSHTRKLPLPFNKENQEDYIRTSHGTKQKIILLRVGHPSIQLLKWFVCTHACAHTQRQRQVRAYCSR